MPNHIHPIQQLLISMEWQPLDNRERDNSNNNHPTLWQLRDHLFKVLFERACIFYAATVDHRVGKLIEYTSLAVAILSFFIFGYIHVTFVQEPVTCLEKEAQSWSREGILRIEISLLEEKIRSSNVSKYYNSTLTPAFDAQLMQKQKYLPSIQPKTPAKRASSSVVDDEILDTEKSPEFINRTIPYTDSVSDPDYLTPITTTLSETEMFTSTVWPVEKYIIEYALEYGFLRLSSSARENVTVQVHTVVLDPKKDQCFGNEFSRFLMKNVLGYNDILMGSLRYLVEKDINKGYVRNVVTGEQYRFIDKSVSWTSYFSAAFFMLVFTLTVSMLLRYSHHQIFLFVVELLHVFEMNAIISFPAGPLLTVVLALVGMEAIMSEFFNDSVTAFYIIIVVWLADQYDSICCHTPLSKKHWLRLFFLYHFAFYAYHYRFNGQYSILALVTTWLFIQHSMIFFFHRYELPHVLRAFEQSEADYEGGAPRGEQRTP